MPTPVTYASARQFIGVGKEVSGQGTSVAMTNTLLVEHFTPKDKPKWLQDKALRGSMVEIYGVQQGTIDSEFAAAGPVFCDTLPWWLSNLLGDIAETGATVAPNTTLSAAASAGAPSIQTAASIPAGTVIQIDSGPTAEIRTTATATGPGPYTIPFAPGQGALMYGHAFTAPVTGAAAPYVHAHSTLNSGSGQPGTMTITDFQGPVATTGARLYPGACLSDLTLKWNAESQLFTKDIKGAGWPSVPAGSVPTSAPSTAPPIPSWRAVLGIGGPASGATQVRTVLDGEFIINRKLEPIWGSTGTQAPYLIQRGVVTVKGKLVFVAADESPYTNMINNVQPQLQFVINNGLAGANLAQVQIDVANAAFQVADIDRGKSAVMYKVDFEGISNTTNAGGSAGYSPIKVAVTNGVVGNTYQ